MTELPTDLTIFYCEQGSPEWHAAKLGVPSASRFADVAAGGDGLTRARYMRQLAGEIMTGVPAENFLSGAMLRGKEMEARVRAQYAMLYDRLIEPTGFFKRGLKTGFAGASTDGLIGNDCVLEVKTKAPELLIELLKDGRVPAENMPQCQGNMLVTGRSYCELVIGYVPEPGALLKSAPGLPMFRRRVARDPSRIAKLEVALEVFNEELAEMVERLRTYHQRGSWR